VFRLVLTRNSVKSSAVSWVE